MAFINESFFEGKNINVGNVNDIERKKVINLNTNLSYEKERQLMSICSR